MFHTIWYLKHICYLYTLIYVPIFRTDLIIHYAIMPDIIFSTMFRSDIGRNWPNFSKFSSFGKKNSSAIFHLSATSFFSTFSTTAETKCISNEGTSYTLWNSLHPYQVSFLNVLCWWICRPPLLLKPTN